MKKIFCASLFAGVIAVSSIASAGFQPTAPQQPGGFKGPSAGVTTVADALKAKDDTLVVLTGHIEKETAKEAAIRILEKELWKNVLLMLKELKNLFKEWYFVAKVNGIAEDQYAVIIFILLALVGGLFAFFLKRRKKQEEDEDIEEEIIDDQY